MDTTNGDNEDPNFMPISQALTQFINTTSNDINGPLLMNPTQFNITVSLSAQKSVFKRMGKSITYLNQNQQYELSLNFPEAWATNDRRLLTVIKIGFEDRKMQIKRKEKFLEWFNDHPDIELFDIIGASASNVYNVKRAQNHRGKMQFEWRAIEPATPLLKVYCLSSDFCENKSGGEEGIVLSFKISTFDVTYSGFLLAPIMNPVHKCSSNVKVFKMKGADRKYKQELSRYQKEMESFNERYADVGKKYNELKYQHEQSLDLIREKEVLPKKKAAEVELKKEEKKQELSQKQSDMIFQLSKKQSDMNLQLSQKKSEFLQKKSDMDLQLSQKKSEFLQKKSDMEHQLFQKKSDMTLELSQKKSEIDSLLDDVELDLSKERTAIEREKRELELELKIATTQMGILDNQMKNLADEFNYQYNEPCPITDFEMCVDDITNSPESSLELSLADPDMIPSINTTTSIFPVKRKQELELMDPKLLKEGGVLTNHSSTEEVMCWLECNGFGHLRGILENYSGEDLLGLERDDVLLLCEPKDGIRLYNKLKLIKNPVVKEIFVEFKWSMPSRYFRAEFVSISIDQVNVETLKREIQIKGNIPDLFIEEIYIAKANGVNYMLTDDDIGQIKNHQAYFASLLKKGDIENPYRTCIVLAEVVQQIM